MQHRDSDFNLLCSTLQNMDSKINQGLSSLRTERRLQRRWERERALCEFETAEQRDLQVNPEGRVVKKQRVRGRSRRAAQTEEQGQWLNAESAQLERVARVHYSALQSYVWDLTNETREQLYHHSNDVSYSSLIGELEIWMFLDCQATCKLKSILLKVHYHN